MNDYVSDHWLKDKSITTVGMCDYKTFQGDTLKEKMENVYVKLVELHNILLSKTGHWERIPVKVGQTIYDMFDCSTSHPSDGRNIRYGKFEIQLDKTLPSDGLTIESCGTKAALSIKNIGD